MTLGIASGVWELSTSTGTGNFSLAGASTARKGLRSFVGAGLAGRYVVYQIRHKTLDEWEWGVNLITDATPDTLTRDSDDKVMESSNSGNRVNFSAGTKDVFLHDMPNYCTGSFVTYSTTISLDATQHDILVDTTSTLTLPSAASFNGKSYSITNIGSSATVTIAHSGSDTIEGPDSATSTTQIVLYAKGDNVFLRSDGTKWHVLGGSLKPHSARVYRVTSNQTIPTGTLTLAQFNGEVDDDFGLHDNSTNNSRITVLRAGYYLIGTTLVWASNNTGVRYHLLTVNGSAVAAHRRSSVDNSETISSVRVKLAAGDYVEVYVSQASGGDLDLLAVGTSGTTLWVTEQR